MGTLPPATDFPRNPALLEREQLDTAYLELRRCYISAIRSRGQHRRHANKAREETALLRQSLLDLAQREASVRKEIYGMLEIVTAITAEIEDAGDELVQGFATYKGGRRSFQGGGHIGDLIRAVIQFINRWGRAKDQLVHLNEQQQQLLERSREFPPPATPTSAAQLSSQEEKDG